MLFTLKKSLKDVMAIQEVKSLDDQISVDNLIGTEAKLLDSSSAVADAESRRQTLKHYVVDNMAASL